MNHLWPRRHASTALLLLACLGVLGGCAARARPEELQRLESHTAAAPPDAVFAAARAYYAAQNYSFTVVDTDARLLSAWAPSNMDGPFRREVVWVRPGRGGGSDLRIKALWGASWLEEHRQAALAQEFEAIALGRRVAADPPPKELPR